jgi:hypothetical protein
LTHFAGQQLSAGLDEGVDVVGDVVAAACADDQRFRQEDLS